MIGDHDNPHLIEAERPRDSSVVGDGVLVFIAFVVSTGLVVALIALLVVWAIR